jgi:hypothetical protein
MTHRRANEMLYVIATEPICLGAPHLADDRLLARITVPHGTDSSAKSPRSSEFEIGARVARRLDLARRYLEVLPDVPVRCARRAGLGDAYIAPTENLIHDGAVEPGHRDLTLTVRGFLRPM